MPRQKIIGLNKWLTIDVVDLVCEALSTLKDRGFFGDENDEIKKTAIASAKAQVIYEIRLVKAAG